MLKNILLFNFLFLNICCNNPIDYRTFIRDSNLNERDIKKIYTTYSEKEKYLFNYSEFEREYNYISNKYLLLDNTAMTIEAKLGALNYCFSNIQAMSSIENDKKYGIESNRSIFLIPELLSFVRKEILKNPNEAKFYALSGDIKYYSKEYQGTLEDYNNAIDLDPKNGDYYYRKADALFALNRDAEACVALKMSQNLGKKVFSSEFKFCN